MGRKKFNLIDLIDEDFDMEIEKFQKIKNKPKRANKEISEYQIKKKKLNHHKRGKR